MKDLHVHTPFCPHGSADPIEDYILHGIRLGLETLTFTEHAPLPIPDPLSSGDSAMASDKVQAYLDTVAGLKAKYADRITINAGFEVDYLEGQEHLTTAFLEAHPETIPHSILSVHFLKVHDTYYSCVDYSAEDFLGQAGEVGLHTLYTRYAETLEKALSLPFGDITPRKIGHLNLIHKFEKRYVIEDPINWGKLLLLAKKNGYRIDYNFSGIDKVDYGLPYPKPAILEIAKELEIPLETGSDAHRAEEVGRYFTSL